MNARCLEDVDPTGIPAREFGGEHWEEAAKAYLGPPKAS